MAERPSWAVSDADGIINVEDARVANGAGYTTDGQAVADKRSGFLPSVGDPGAVTASATADTFVHVAPFQRITQSSRGNGPYGQTLDTQKDIDVLGPHPSDSTNDRHDLIIGQQADAFYGDSDSAFLIRHVVGTAASTPSDPTVDGSPDYYELARIRVAAGSTVIDGSDIDDLRPPEWTVAAGGVLPVADSAERDAVPSPYNGLMIWRQDRNWAETWDGAAWRTAGNLTVSSESDLSAITTPYEGQMIFAKAEAALFRFDGTTWIRHTGPRPFGHAGLTSGFVGISGGVYPALNAQILRHGVTFSSNRLVVPRDGLYEITSKAYFTGSAAYSGAWTVEINGTDAASGNGQLWKEDAADYMGWSTVARELVAGDAMELFMDSPASTYGTTGFNGSYIEVKMIDE